MGGHLREINIKQDIETSSGNSSTDNLASSATFTGTAEETLGISGIQTYVYADQDCTVYVDQGLDGTNWDITDSIDCLANEACSRIFYSVAPYFRIRVTNTGSSTTTVFRCSAGMTPIINPLPRALTDDDRLKVESTLTGKENSERHVWVAPTNTLAINKTVRLVGTNFDGTTKDPNFWAETVTGSGSATQNGEVKLQTGTTANSTAKYQSVRRARFVVGSALQFFGAFKFNDADETDNVRRCGAYDTNEGLFFELDGSTFSVGYRSGASDTLVNSGSFNGNYGPAFAHSNSVYYKMSIEWSPMGAFWYIDGKLLHKITKQHLVRVLTLPILIENINDNGNDTNVAFDCLGVSISRRGELHTAPTYKYISGAATTILKYGAGELHTIVNNDNSGSLIAYDNTAGSGTIIASIDLAKVLGTLTFDAPFSNGLTIVTVGAGAKITVTYE